MGEVALPMEEFDFEGLVERYRPILFPEAS